MNLLGTLEYGKLLLIVLISPSVSTLCFSIQSDFDHKCCLRNHLPSCCLLDLPKQLLQVGGNKRSSGWLRVS